MELMFTVKNMYGKKFKNSALFYGFVLLIIIAIMVSFTSNNIAKQKLLQSELAQQKIDISLRDSLINQICILAVNKNRKDADQLLKMLVEMSDFGKKKYIIDDLFCQEYRSYTDESENHKILMSLSTEAFKNLCKAKFDTVIYQTNFLNKLLPLKLYDERDERRLILIQRAKEEKDRFRNGYFIDPYALAGQVGCIKAFYKNNVRNGPYVIYFSDSTKAQEGSYKNGMLDGPSKTYLDGQLVFKCTYRNDSKVGKQYNYEDGKLVEIFTWSNGGATGPFTTYTESGRISGQFINGEMNGRINFYNSNGALTNYCFYDNGTQGDCYEITYQRNNYYTPSHEYPPVYFP